MKTILCYGDSNTWGYDPRTGLRYGPDIRWTGVLQRELGADCRVIEEGLNGRTTVWDDPLQDGRNGRGYFGPCLQSHCPLDLLVLMLGSNDLKHRFGLSAYDIASGAGLLVEAALAFRDEHCPTPPRVLLMAPPPLGRLTELADMFEGGLEKSLELGRQYRRVAEENGCDFLDAGGVIVSSEVDGIHFDPEQHARLGRSVAGKAREILGL